jgi:hypothetical protein
VPYFFCFTSKSFAPHLMILSSYYFSFALSFSDICLCRPVVALDMCICTERTCTECRYVKMGSLEPTKTYA